MAEQKTKTYIPTISYNGKELPVKIVLFVVLLILVFTSCKSQSPGAEKKLAHNNISYVIIKDSAYCKPISSNSAEYSFYSLPFFKVNKDIVLSNGGDIYEGFSFFNRDSLQIQLNMVIKDREEWCIKEDTHSGLIELSHEVTYNEKGVVSFILYYIEYGGSVHTYKEYYTYSTTNQKINIATGKGSILNIFKKEKVRELISSINQHILNHIQNTLTNKYDDFGKEISSAQKRNIEERLNNGAYTIEELPLEWVIEVNEIGDSQNEVGITFYEISVPNIITDASNDYAIFFSFKELHPYLVESFKKQIGI